MEITRDSVNQWLVSERRSQSWLAEKCGVTDQAVSNWLRANNPRPISANAQIIIRALMEEDAAKSSAKPPHNLVLEFDDAQYTPIEQAALAARETVREWAKRTLNEAASMDVQDIASTIIPIDRVAEDPAPYRFTPRPNILAAAGSPIAAEIMDMDGVGDTIQVRIHGLSMEPKLHDGDVITMRHKRVSRNPWMKKGLIYLVQYDGGYTVKRYNTRPARAEEKGEEWAEGGKVKVLQALNPSFPEIIITEPVEWIAWLEE